MVESWGEQRLGTVVQEAVLEGLPSELHFLV